MPTAHRLPSGSWRCQITVNGSRRSVTADTKKAAELAASDLIRSSSAVRVSGTFGEAVERFLADRANILSPSTLRGYKLIQDNNLGMISPIRLSGLTNADVQRQINTLAADHSPKTVRNVYGLITAVIKYTRPDLILTCHLPAPKRSEMSIPDNADLSPLISACLHNQDLLIAVLLASSCGLRLSEICGLTWQDLDLDAGSVTVSKALVRGSDDYILKSPKSRAGYRSVIIPPPTVEYLKPLKSSADPTARVITRTPRAVNAAFTVVRKHLGMDFRFHDLRHYYASILLALGVPDKYAMTLMGHSTAYTLQHVYQHLMSDKSATIEQSISNHFTALNLQTAHEPAHEK